MTQCGLNGILFPWHDKYRGRPVESARSYLKGAVAMAQMYGYVRVSTREQHEDRQLFAMRDFGVTDDNIFLDKQSGKDFDRQAYRKLVKKIKPGDTLVIKSIDRLGRD